MIKLDLPLDDAEILLFTVGYEIESLEDLLEEHSDKFNKRDLKQWSNNLEVLKRIQVLLDNAIKREVKNDFDS